MSSCRSSNDGNYRYPNPELDFEKIVQYEIGFDQNIADKLRLDVTLFYKDGKNLTNLGVQTGGRDDEQFGTSSNPITRIYPDRNNPNAEGIGSTAFFDINTSGGTLEARGLDISLESLFLRNVCARLIYNMSYATSDKYGPSNLYETFEDGLQNSRDQFHGGSNDDLGTSGSFNRRWNPNHTIKFNAVLNSPADLGPTVGNFHPLGNWTLNWYTQWAAGQLYTFHPPGDLSAEPNNRRWAHVNQYEVVQTDQSYGCPSCRIVYGCYKFI